MTRRLRTAFTLAAALFAVIGFALTPWGKALEMRLSDARLRLLAQPGAADAVIVVAIDEAALAEIGPWPWPRHVTAEFLRRLVKYAPAIIGLDIVFVPQGGSDNSMELASAIHESPVPIVVGQLLLPAPAETGTDGLGKFPIPDENNYPARAQSVLGPESGIAEIAAVGHINSHLSGDGIVRHIQPVICTGQGCSPSLSLAMILEFLGVAGKDQLHLQFRNGQWILALGGKDALLDLGADAQLEIPWQAPSPHRYVSARDVWRETLPVEIIKDKFILVGGIALGLGDRVATPVAPHLPGVEAHARFIAVWLSEHGFPVSALPMTWSALAIACQFTVLWLLGRQLLLLWVAGFGTALLWLATVAIAYQQQNLLPLLVPAAFPPVGSLALTLWQINEERLHLGERIRQFLPRPLAESLIRHHLLPAPERAWSTVLYADLVDYTRFSLRHTPEEVAYWGNTGVDLVIRHIRDNGGHIDNIAGDGLLAYWRGEDRRSQALAALACLRGIMAELPPVNAILVAEGYEPLRIGLGLHAGDLVAGMFGEQHLRYTVLGEVANLAHRIERETRTLKLSPLVSVTVADLVEREHMREIALPIPIGSITTLFHPKGRPTL